jgi:hypothetical protein
LGVILIESGRVKTNRSSVCRVGLKQSFGKIVLLVLTQNEPSVVYFLIHHVHLHHTVLVNELNPVIAGESERAVRAQFAQLSKLDEADKLFNVEVEKGAVFPPVLNFKAKHLFLVLFNYQKVDLRLNIEIIALELVYEFHLLLIKVLLALRT